MARRKKQEEHENLERWLVSYSDFITLLFATFVVLYALSQVDIAEFTKLETSLREAFSSSPTVMEGKQGILNQQTAILEGGANSPQINPIMLEFLSQKYEASAMEDVKNDVEKLKKAGIKAEVSEKGLVLKFDDNALKFRPNSAVIDESSKEALKKVGDIIASKFQIHVIRVEGHTDSDIPAKGSIYPGNWELSTARSCAVINFLTGASDINPKLLIAVGFADSNPLVPNTSPQNKAKNRRVEIVILKNKYGKLESKDLQEILKQKFEGKTNASDVPADKEQTVEEKLVKPLTLINDENTESAPVHIQNELYLRENERIKASDTSVQRPSFMKDEEP